MSPDPKHFIRGEHSATDYDGRSGTSPTQRLMIIECCGCENLALVKATHFSENIGYYQDPVTGEEHREEIWDKAIYPPVSSRAPPPWFEDLPDPTLRDISEEIYKSLQSESHYLATFGSRTLIDRLIVLTVGDQSNFGQGLQALQDEGKISQRERDILNPVIEAGNAAAHRGWVPTKDQLTVILDTIEGLIHGLLVLPKLAEELEGVVPARGMSTISNVRTPTVPMKDKIEAAPKKLRAIYDELAGRLVGLGESVTSHPQKHYIAFRRNRNFASVQIYNQKNIIKVYLNLNPEDVAIDEPFTRDVRLIGHFGTGDLEIIIKSKEDIDRANELFRESYERS